MSGITRPVANAAKRPTPDAMRTAAEWLDCNEGAEAGQCRAVAAWLRAEAEAAEVRAIAKHYGTTAARVRTLAARNGFTAGQVLSALTPKPGQE